MKSKLRNAFLGAVLASGLGACATTPPTNQPIDIEIDNENTVEANIEHIVEINDLITRMGTNRIIYEFNKAQRAIPYVTNSNNSPTITIKINSPGGSVDDGYRIIRTIKNSRSQVRLKCEEQASSMAAIILITATGRNRDATQDCNIMIHQSYYAIPDPDDPRRNLTTTIYEALLPHYQIAKENPNIQKFIINQPGSPPYELSRNSLIDLVQQLTEFRNTVKEKMSATTYLTANDVEIMLRKGDTYFSAESAIFAGMIDTIEGTPPSSIQLQKGQREFCSNLPELSLCT